MISRALRRVKSLDQRSLRVLILLGAIGVLGWVLVFSRHYFPSTWEEPLLAAAALLIGMKLGAFILFTGAALTVKAFRWLRPN
jgi:hypothetical protein